LAAISGFTNLSYGKHLKQQLDVFRPSNDTQAPFVLLIHGGGWAGGSKEQYRRTSLPLVEAGFACATVGYRLLPETAWPEIAWDVARAVNYLLQQADELGINPERLVTWGSSAGGHLALCYQAWGQKWVADGVVPAAAEVIGTVAQCPVVEFPKPVPDHINLRQVMNGYPHAEVSPNHIDPELFRNVMLVQGDEDQTTPPAQAKIFIERLQAAGVRARLEIIPGAEHGFGYDILSTDGQQCLDLAIDYIRKLFAK
jgi:acetyl esterase/lipase